MIEQGIKAALVLTALAAGSAGMLVASETAGGAAYARARARVFRGGSVEAVVAGQTATDINGAASTVSVAGQVFVRAAGGLQSAAFGAPGLGAPASSCTGEKIVAGGAGGALGVSGVAGS